MPNRYYHLCCRYRGRLVEIRDKFGKVHRGIITRVTPTHVYLKPMTNPGPRGFGFGYYGGPFFGRPFFGFGAAAFAVSLAAIAAIAAIPFAFFW